MLNPEAYRQAIAVQGEQILHLKAMPHTCFDPTTGYDQQRGCTDCERGYIYEEQTRVPPARGLVQQQTRRLVHSDGVGLIYVSELHLTTMADEVLFGMFDKVVLLDRAMHAKERVRRGDDLLPHDRVTTVLEVSCGGTVYVADTDYSYAAGVITWLDDGAVGPLDLYAVEYQYNPTYWYVGQEFRPARAAFGYGSADLTVPLAPQRGLLSQGPPGM